MVGALPCSWIRTWLSVVTMAPFAENDLQIQCNPYQSQRHFSQNKTYSMIHVEAQEIPNGQNNPEGSSTAGVPGLDFRCTRARATETSLVRVQSRLMDERREQKSQTESPTATAIRFSTNVQKTWTNSCCCGNWILHVGVCNQIPIFQLYKEAVQNGPRALMSDQELGSYQRKMENASRYRDTQWLLNGSRNDSKKARK